tara:strand:+ start:131 stop:343 length:213 start_codon:yes stop_codon:yes gene_type:complete
MQSHNKSGPVARVKGGKRVHINLQGVEWDDLERLAILADVSRSHIARLALRYVLAHPELVLHTSQETVSG